MERAYEQVLQVMNAARVSATEYWFVTTVRIVLNSK